MSDNTEAGEPASDSVVVVLEHGGSQIEISVPTGTDLGHIRTLGTSLDEIGAPESYTLGVNGTGQDDTTVLQDGDLISFRPVSGNKG
jgi:hypothetical protein